MDQNRYETVNNYDEDSDEEENEPPMALVVEDEPVTQEMFVRLLAAMNIKAVCATTVDEAMERLEECNLNGITIDLVLLDYMLQDGSTGLDFLKIRQQKNLLKNALIYVLSGMKDSSLVSSVYQYGTTHFLRKPITKNVFMNEEMKIKQHIHDLNPLQGFKFIEEIGTGASSVVHLARNKKTKDLVAIKTVEYDVNEDNRKFMREMEFLKDLSAPTILEFKDCKIVNNKVYLILEFAENGTLTKKINKRKKDGEKFDVDTILNYMTELILGLYVAHSKKLMHRDIKPDNLLICKNDVLKIGDFGIAKATERGASTQCGTLFYRAPETFNYENYTNKVDIWSSGIVLYEMIMLKRPYDDNNQDVIKEKINKEDYTPLPESTDERLKKLFKMCTYIDPNTRANVIELLNLPFIKNVVQKLFDDKVLINNDLYQKFLKDTSSALKFVDNKENVSEKILEKVSEYIKNFKFAILIEANCPKSIYKSGYFGPTISNALKGSDIESVMEEHNISEDEVNELLKGKFLENILNSNEEEFDSSDKVFYKIKIYEKPNIDNSIIGIETVTENEEKIEDPVDLSLQCLKKGEELLNIVQETYLNDPEKLKTEIIKSDENLSFLSQIRKLRFINVKSCNSKTKLALMLNIYQTMLIHQEIKCYFNDDNQTNSNSLVDQVKSMFKVNSNQSSSLNQNMVTYEIDNQTLNLYEFKNIVFRRNKKPYDAYMKLVYDTDPRVQFINSTEKDIPKFLCVCLDFQNKILEEENLLNSKYIQFTAQEVDKQLEEYYKKFIFENVKRDDNTLNLPLLFKTYMLDFAQNEIDMVKFILKGNTDPNMKPISIAKLLASKDLSLNYF